MKITQVRFPCGRIGLEVETTHYGGSEITPSYAYYYNGDVYDRGLAKRDGIALTFDYYGRIQGLVRVNKRNLNVFEMIRFASSHFMSETGIERQLS